jgi:hypothetical protein
MALISNSMHWAWKITLIPSAVWLLMILSENYPHLDDGYVILISTMPVALWITIRWIYIGKALKDT